MAFIEFILVMVGYHLWDWWGVLIAYTVYNFICLLITISNNGAEQQESESQEQEHQYSYQTANSSSNPYSILNLDESCSNDEVKQAYRHMAKLYHPDRHVGYSEMEKAVVAEKFRAATEAYEIIKQMRHMA